MRQDLRQRPPLVLRRLLLPPRSRLRLRLIEKDRPPRKSCQPRLQHVALFRASPPSRRLHRSKRHRRHPPRGLAPAGLPPVADETLFSTRQRLFSLPSLPPTPA